MITHNSFSDQLFPNIPLLPAPAIAGLLPARCATSALIEYAKSVKVINGKSTIVDLELRESQVVEMSSLDDTNIAILPRRRRILTEADSRVSMAKYHGVASGWPKRLKTIAEADARAQRWEHASIVASMLIKLAFCRASECIITTTEVFQLFEFHDWQCVISGTKHSAATPISGRFILPLSKKGRAQISNVQPIYSGDLPGEKMMIAGAFDARRGQQVAA